MSKRGQVTLFIIIAIVIVAAALAGWFIYRNYQKVKQERIAQDISLLKSYIKENIKEITAKRLILIGLQGGYSEAPDKSIKVTFEKVPYYYYKGQILIPSLDVIENQLSQDIDQQLSKINFSNFSDIKILAENATTTTIINEEKVEFIITWPITVSSDKTVVKLDEKYVVDYPIRIKKLVEIARNLTQATAKEPGYIEIELISYLQENNDIIITPFIIEKDVIYKMDDQKFKLRDQPYYTFQFATKNE